MHMAVNIHGNDLSGAPRHAGKPRRLSLVSVELGPRRDVLVHHEKVQPLGALLVMHGGDQHAAGIDAHHGSRRQVGDGDAGLAHQFLRLIVLVDAAEDHTVLAAAVIQSELEELLALLHGLAGLHLHGTEVRLAERLKIHEIPEQGLDLHLGEVDLLLRLGGLSGLGGSLGLAGGLHGREYYPGIIITSHKFL